jgi:tetratricopeptide (TPR) repeat protein
LLLHIFALFFFQQGEEARALELFKHAVEIRIKTLGPEHPLTIDARINMAATYAELGELDEALRCYEHGLPLKERALGPKHPEVTFPLRSIVLCVCVSS